MPVHSRVTTPSAFATGKTKRVPVETATPVYGEELFAIKYWRGHDGFYDIKNGIDLENKGGVVWVKQAAGSSNQPMIWFDTLAGVQKYYTLDNATYQQTDSQAIVSFNTDGFRIGSHVNWNHNNVDGYVCYTWAKHEKFFTMLTYEGDGNGTRNIAHDLNGELGMVVVKSQADASGGSYEDRNGWLVWQRGQNSYTSPGDMHNYTFLNKDNSPNQDNGYFTNSTLPADPGMTRTHIRVGNNLNVTGILYHVYIWGHNELPEDCIFGPERNKPMVFNGIIPDSSQNFIEQDMGMPVQWLLNKSNDGWGDYGGSYRVVDKMRGMNAISDSPWFSVRAQSPQVQEGSYGSIGYKSARGFTPNSQFGSTSAIYMGIGDSAYKNVSENTTLNPTARGVIQSFANDGEPTALALGGDLGSGSDVDRPTRSLDFTLVKRTSSTSGSGANAGPTNLINRVTGNKYTYYAHTSGYANTFANDEGTNPNRSRVNGGYYRMSGGTQPTEQGASSPGYLYMRPPLISATGRLFAMGLSTHRKFFDIQCYNGVATNKTVYHNLEFEPAMIWIKVQSSTPWTVYHKDVGLSYRMSLGSSTGKVAYTSGQGGIVSVDEEKVVLSNGTLTNDTNVIHTMYLFANYPGWSKIGLYNGTGTIASGVTQDIDCGFSPTDGVLNTANGGPANLLIKRVDAGSSGSWWMWNSHYDNIWQSTQASGQRGMKLNETGDQWSSGMIFEWIKRNPGETGFRLTDVGSNIMNYAGADSVTHNINVTASGSSAYTLSGTDRNGSVSGSNPTVTAYVGDTIVFSVSASGHPFYIRVSNGGANVSTPAASSQGSDSGNVGWIPNTPGTYYYQCGNHAAMIGQIVVQASPASEYIYWAIGPDNTPP